MSPASTMVVKEFLDSDRVNFLIWRFVPPALLVTCLPYWPSGCDTPCAAIVPTVSPHRDLVLCPARSAFHDNRY